MIHPPTISYVSARLANAVLWTLLGLFVLGLAGCATPAPVPVAMQRALPRPPVECDRADPPFPKIPHRPGRVVTPEMSARWAVQVRHWRDQVAANRKACRVYTKRMRNWK